MSTCVVCIDRTSASLNSALVRIRNQHHCRDQNLLLPASRQDRRRESYFPVHSERQRRIAARLKPSQGKVRCACSSLRATKPINSNELLRRSKFKTSDYRVNQSSCRIRQSEFAPFTRFDVGLFKALGSLSREALPRSGCHAYPSAGPANIDRVFSSGHPSGFRGSSCRHSCAKA